MMPGRECDPAASGTRRVYDEWIVHHHDADRRTTASAARHTAMKFTGASGRRPRHRDERALLSGRAATRSPGQPEKGRQPDLHARIAALLEQDRRQNMKRVVSHRLGVISPWATMSTPSGTRFAPARAASGRSQDLIPPTSRSSSPPRCAILTRSSTWTSWISCTAISTRSSPWRPLARPWFDSRLASEIDPERIGVYIGTGIGGIAHVHDRAPEAARARTAPRLPVLYPDDDRQHGLEHDRHALRLQGSGHADGHGLRLRHQRHRRGHRA